MESQLVNICVRVTELLVILREVILEMSPRLVILGLPRLLADTASEDMFFAIIMYPKSTIWFVE